MNAEEVIERAQTKVSLIEELKKERDSHKDQVKDLGERIEAAQAEVNALIKGVATQQASIFDPPPADDTLIPDPDCAKCKGEGVYYDGEARVTCPCLEKRLSELQERGAFPKAD